jgi:hypothetical protein
METAIFFTTEAWRHGDLPTQKRKISVVNSKKQEQLNPVLS